MKKDYESFERIVRKHPHVINDLRDEYDWTFLMKAIILKRHHDIIEYLLKTFHKNIHYTAKNDHGRTAFHYAAMRNNMKAMELLITNDRRGVNVQHDDDGWTPLHEAAILNDKSMIEFLLMHGANPHLKDIGGLTAEVEAIKYGMAYASKFMNFTEIAD